MFINKYLLIFYCMSGTVLDTKDTEVNKTDEILTLMNLHSNRGRQSYNLLGNYQALYKNNKIFFH